MADFLVRFGICNLFLCGIIGILFLARHLFRNILSARMQYHLWFLLLGLLIVPFLPFRLFKFPQIILWFQTLSISPVSKADTIAVISPSKYRLRNELLSLSMYSFSVTVGV